MNDSQNRPFSIQNCLSSHRIPYHPNVIAIWTVMVHKSIQPEAWPLWPWLVFVVHPLLNEFLACGLMVSRHAMGLRRKHHCQIDPIYQDRRLRLCQYLLDDIARAR